MSLFGQASQPAVQPSQGGLFGGVKGPSPFLPQGGTNTGTAGGLFGQPQQQQQPQQAGGLFGQSTAGGGIGGGLFSQSSTTGTTGGMFGQPQQQQQQQQQQGGGIFGQQQQQQQPPGGSLFGQPQQAGGLFGQSQQQQPQQQAPGASIFGGASGAQQSGFGRTLNPLQQSQTSTAASIVSGQMQKLWQAWGVGEPDCRFHTYLYNQVDNEVIANSYEPGPNEDKLKFDAAMRKRPNSKSVPVLVRGFDDLQIRMQQQENQIKLYRATLHVINNKLVELSQHHDLKTTIKLAEAISRHQQLAHRILSLSAKVQVLKNRGYALQPEEEQLRTKLEILMKNVSDPGVHGRMNEIWARMQMINQKAKLLEREINDTSATVDPEQIQKMAMVLQTHEKGIKGLQEEMQRLEEVFEKWEKEKQALNNRQFGR